MSCSCKKIPCGCNDRAKVTINPCDIPECGNPNPCSETFSTECSVYTGDDIVDLDIQYGDNMAEIIQKITLLFTNPGCAVPGNPCQSPVGFKSTLITGTVAKFSWNAVPGALSYHLEYRLPSASTWTANQSVTTTYDTIGPLSTATEYYVRVISSCTGGSCTSVTLGIKTLST